MRENIKKMRKNEKSKNPVAECNSVTKETEWELGW